MAQYASTTDVSPEKSRADIEALLKKYGATAFMFGWDTERDISLIEFRIGGRGFRMNVPMPDPANAQEMARLRQIAVDTRRNSRDREKLIEQGRRQRWRAMVLYVRAVLEAVENRLLTIEAALLPSLVLPNGRTVGEFMGPQIERAVIEGRMPPLLPAPAEGKQP